LLKKKRVLLYFLPDNGLNGPTGSTIDVLLAIPWSNDYFKTDKKKDKDLSP